MKDEEEKVIEIIQIIKAPFPIENVLKFGEKMRKWGTKEIKKNDFNGLEIKEKRECIAKVKDQTI